MSATTADSTASHKKVAMRFYDDLLNEGNFALVHELMTPDFVNHTNGSGLEGFVAFARNMHEAFPGLRFTVEDLFGEGDRIAVRWRMDGVHQGVFLGNSPTGKPVVNRANVIFGFRGDRISDLWIQFDGIGFLKQLGGLPENFGTPAAPQQASAAN